MEFKNGTVVKAAAGRDCDKNGYFIVTGTDERGLILIADGKSRPLARPKHKNPKHLKVTKMSVVCDGLTDKELRKLLGELK